MMSLDYVAEMSSETNKHSAGPWAPSLDRCLHR